MNIYYKKMTIYNYFDQFIKVYPYLQGTIRVKVRFLNTRITINDLKTLNCAKYFLWNERKCFWMQSYFSNTGSSLLKIHLQKRANNFIYPNNNVTLKVNSEYISTLFKNAQFLKTSIKTVNHGTFLNRLIYTSYLKDLQRARYSLKFRTWKQIT